MEWLRDHDEITDCRPATASSWSLLTKISALCCPPADISTLRSPLSVARLLLFLGSSRSDVRLSIRHLRHWLRSWSPRAILYVHRELQPNPDLHITATLPSECPQVSTFICRLKLHGAIRGGNFYLACHLESPNGGKKPPSEEIARTVSSQWRNALSHMDIFSSRPMEARLTYDVPGRRPEDEQVGEGLR